MLQEVFFKRRSEWSRKKPTGAQTQTQSWRDRGLLDPASHF